MNVKVKPEVNIFIFSFITALILVFSVPVSLAEISVGRITNGTWEVTFSPALNLTYPNDNASFILICAAEYPVEWVFDDDDESQNSVGRIRLEQTLRQFGPTAKEDLKEYIAAISFVYNEPVEVDIAICRSVSNHNDSILVQMKPINNGQQLQILDSNGSEELKHLLQTISTRNRNAVKAPCRIKFSIVSDAINYFWRCATLNDSTTGSIIFHRCTGASQCSNSFRRLKDEQGSCVTMLTTTPEEQGGWNIMQFRDRFAGVAVCTLNGDKNTRAAVEYFSIKRPEEPYTKLKLGFSLPRPEERLWVIPEVSDLYYTAQRWVETGCRCLRHGFASKPIMVIKLNGSTILEGAYEDDDEFEIFFQKALGIDLQVFGTGNYQIQCLAAVWNSTVWANKTMSFDVRDVIRPYFDSDFEIVHLANQTEGGKISLLCDAHGDPSPTVNWDVANTDETLIDGPRLTISANSSVVVDGSIITCTARNEFGDKIVKKFKISLPPEENHDSEPWPQIQIAIISVIFGLVFVVALGYSYSHIRKLRKRISIYLTKEEVKEFREGKPSLSPDSLSNFGPNETSQFVRRTDYGQIPSTIQRTTTGNEDVQVQSDSMPYNDEFDVPRENIVVDFSTEIGSGQFGVVYKGSVRRKGKHAKMIQIAVKTVRRNVDLSYFKALMSELKILAYVGRHENIANLVCAWTDDIQKRELFVGIELCETSLLKYLQGNRSIFDNCVSIDGSLVSETSLSEQNGRQIGKKFTTHTLIKWAREIASGMEFLAVRKVVHADLAARNVLLSFDTQAKICDFGLARQLVNYIYVKSEKCPLPWAWMAIESLTERKFSSSSDAWTYGVVLWELFSLGKMPFSAFSWGKFYMDQLINGVRMPKPDYATDHIYNKMMQCWLKDPKARPKFQDLKLYFEAMEMK